MFERKGNYQLFHKTGNLDSILRDGYIIAGGKQEDDEYAAKWWDFAVRKNVISNWEQNKGDKFITISATRNLDYFGLPALELDVEKISDKYKILPFSENPDYYLTDFEEDKELKPIKNSHLNYTQKLLRAKSKYANKKYWNVKTDKGDSDFGISEELILTDKLDISKYVKRIILQKDNYVRNKDFIKIINEKYPNIEVVEIERWKHIGYIDIKKELRDKEQNKKKVLAYENYVFETRNKDIYALMRPFFSDTPEYVFKQLFYTNDGFFKTEFTKLVNKDASDEKIETIFSDWTDIEWKKEVINVNFNDFTKSTKKLMKKRKMGDLNLEIVPNDKKRNIFHKDLAETTYGDNEPVIMIKSSDGYELLEGWHRTMSILSLGSDDSENYEDWDKVKLNAWIGYR